MMQNLITKTDDTFNDCTTPWTKYCTMFKNKP